MYVSDKSDIHTIGFYEAQGYFILFYFLHFLGDSFSYERLI